LRWHMAGTFADKFEKALAERRAVDPKFGLRTLAKQLAKDDPARAETIRRRLNKYRPKPGGGAAEVAPTEPTRWEIEDALGLERDALKPDEVAAIAATASVFADLLDAVFEAKLRETRETVRAEFEALLAERRGVSA
jgi:hypothetical protein